MHYMWLCQALGLGLSREKETASGKWERTEPRVQGSVQEVGKRVSVRTTPTTPDRGDRSARLGRLGAPTGLYVPAKVLGLDVRFLFDTGASCTVLSTKVWDQIPPDVRPDLEDPYMELSTVGDHAIPNRGSCSLVVEFYGRPFTCTVQVCEISEEAVLGLDILSYLRGRWDWDRGVLELTPPRGGPALTNSPGSVEPSVAPCCQHEDGGSDSICGDPSGQSAECPSNISPPSAMTPPVMEVMREPELGLEELWPVVGWSSTSGPVEEETVAGLLRSIGRSKKLCAHCNFDQSDN